MPRRKKQNFKREIAPDPLYKSILLQKFINVLMVRGKKNTARAIVYGVVDILATKVGGDKSKAVSLFVDACTKVSPVVEVRSRRVGGSTYQIPVRVAPKRGSALAARWLIDAAKARTGKTMVTKLAYELLDVEAGKGAAVKKKADVHKMAEANRAFSHYAW